MGKLVVTEFVSMDGVMQAPGGEKFKYEGWTFDFDRGEDGNQFKLDEILNADPKYVVSTTLKNPQWTNVTVLDSGDATAQVAKLKDEINGTILLAGSRRLVQELLGSDLVDQINLMIFPVILGTGDRMLGEMNEKTKWKLVESREVGPDSILVQSYQ